MADPLAEAERVASLIDDRISPQLVPAIDLVTLDGRTVLVVDVPLSTRRPHCMTRQGPEAGVYVRLGPTTRRADPALVAELERNARGIAFEDLPEPRATLDDIDLAVLSELRGRPTDAHDLLALGLAVAQGGEIVPTYAGILAACPDPTRFLPSAWVQCGRLRGPSGTDIFDQIEIHGPMPLAVDRAVDFLLKHAYKTAVFGRVRRRDVYSIPVEPVREVIVNALVHAAGISDRHSRRLGESAHGGLGTEGNLHGHGHGGGKSQRRSGGGGASGEAGGGPWRRVRQCQDFPAAAQPLRRHAGRVFRRLADVRGKGGQPC